jgi:NTE family protein
MTPVAGSPMLMASSRRTTMTSRALVLGGGGPVGIAWESGVVAGLAQGGVDLGKADFILGTSAGSFVGARLALGEAAATLADPVLAEAARPPREGASRSPADLSVLMRLIAEARGGRRNPAEVRAEIGAFALAAETPIEADFIASFGRSFAGLPVDAWPEQGFACTAVDAEDGSFRLWTKDSGVGVTRAVASSCSVPGIYPPVTLGGRRYIDGGMRSATNADMAGDHELVVILAVRAGEAATTGAQLDDEVESLKDGGATVVVITPDDPSLAAMGVNLMDFRQRRGAAQAGLTQGQGHAAALASLWR